LYTLDQNSGNATINKFSLVNGSWVANGTAYTLASNASGMIAENDGSGGAFLFVTTGNGTANNSLVQLTDTAGYNTALSINTANNVTLFTDTNGDTLKGIDFTPANLPNFSITAAAPPAAGVGAQFTYTFTAANAGPAGATGVSAQVTLPAGLSFVTASGDDGFTASQSGGVVTFSGGTLDAGDSATLTITVTAASPAIYTLPVGAAVIDPGNVIPEGNAFADDNTSAVSTNVSNKPDLTVDVSGPATAFTNQNFTYTLTAGNSGTADAVGDVTVQFTLPNSDLTVASFTGAGFTESQAGPVVTFSGGTVLAGGTAILTVTVTDPNLEQVILAPGAAVIDPSNVVDESNESNNSSTSTVTTNVTLPLVANADTYNANAGATLTVNAANGILANDVGTPVTIVSPVTASTPQTSLPAGYIAASGTQTDSGGNPTYLSTFTSTTAAGGTVTLYPDGSFNYTPPCRNTRPTCRPWPRSAGSASRPEDTARHWRQFLIQIIPASSFPTSSMVSKIAVQTSMAPTGRSSSRSQPTTPPSGSSNSRTARRSCCNIFL
jgi:uncharacterized repeat protein (TIGR01451 family)